MTTSRILLGILLILGLAACSSVRVSQDYDESADFSAYRTYDWFPAPREETGQLRLDNPLLDERVVSAIERTLASKGYSKVSGGEPDFYVYYHLSMQEKLDVRTMNTYYGGVGRRGRWRGWGGVGFDTYVDQYDEGMLVIDIGDARARKLVWRGSGTRRLRESPEPEEVTQQVNEAVSEILKQFPPRRKSGSRAAAPA